jgi:hypothetical protein
MFLNNTQAGAVPETAVPRYPAGGAGKFLSDSVSVFEINFFSAERHWYLLLLMSAGIPLPMVVRHQGHCPRRPWRHPPIARRDAALRRFIPHRDAGRAERRLPTLYGQPQAVFTMPVSKGAYVLGSLAFSSILGTIAATFLVVFGFLAGVHIDIALGLAPSLALAVLSVVGLTMFVVSFAPSLQAENILTSMLSLVLAALSPAYSTTEQAPLLLRLLGWVSPPEVRRRWNRQIAVWTD